MQETNIANIHEGKLANHLAMVFVQLEKLGLKRNGRVDLPSLQAYWPRSRQTWKYILARAREDFLKGVITKDDLAKIVRRAGKN